MTLVDQVHTVTSLDDFATLTQSKAWKDSLATLAKRTDSEAKVEIERLRFAVAVAKNRLSPEHSCPELQTLKQHVFTDGADPKALRSLLTRVSELRAALPLRQHEQLFGRVETTIGQLFAPGLLGNTGYSNRARRARDLFTEFAGQTRIAGAAKDTAGNAAGTAYDLGRDGAFSGHTVHVLHLYTGEGFTFALPKAAFERKGFRVDRRTTPGTPADLRQWLSEAQQLWVISTSSRLLDAEHVQVIREFWQRGGALYIWGDNEPYYADANVLLAALFGPNLSMKGNLHGGQVVREVTSAGRGFQPHLVTTGLEHLFEGITVASLVEDVITGYGFSPLLYGSAGNLITVVRDPTPAAGAVMIDGAFTRLFCQWDEAGSARYVCNAACFLAATTLPAEEPEEESEPEVTLAYDPRGAFLGVCDLTGLASDSWLVLSVEQMGDALRNTSDFVLTDPLAAGADNGIFSDHVYAERMGKWIVEQGSDPFTRRAVVECLPLVDLSHERNLRTFTQLLCKCLMGGKYLPTPVRLLFFAVVDEMREPSRRLKHRDAWDYLYRQCLTNFKSTPEFGELGQKMPLIEAMAAYFSPATDAMIQIRRSFQTVGLIARTLVRERRATGTQVLPIVRRALAKALVADAVATEKVKPGSVKPAIIEMLYETCHCIPKLNSGRITREWPAFARDVSAARLRVERTIEAPLLSAEEQTAVLHALLSLDLRQYTAETALEHLLSISPAVRAVWYAAPVGDVLALLNARFAEYQDPIDWSDPHMGQQPPPFVTTFGPSVYRCVCGEMFGDPKAEITDESVLAMARARHAHFREVYRTGSESWYPTDGTLHYNLHRAVQNVIKEQFAEATEMTEAMVPAVAAYLAHDGKGFLCDPRMESHIRAGLRSYLALRRAGQQHPSGVLTLRVKAEQEQRVLLGRAE